MIKANTAKHVQGGLPRVNAASALGYVEGGVWKERQ